MRRPKVHRVEFGPTRNVVIDPYSNYDGDIVQQFTSYRTRCGITGGSELLNLTGVNNGSGHWCSACWPGAPPTRRQRPVPDGRWW